jgi:glycosyltransferase 2 family protein
MSASARKWLFVAIKLAVAALLIWGVRRTAAQAVDELHERPLRLSPGWLVAAAGFYLAAMLPSAFFWQRVMRAMGQRPGYFAALRAFAIGHLGKYVPGKALVVVLRAGFVRGPAVSATAAAVGVFVETLTMMASGSFIAAALIAINYHQHLLYAAIAILFMLASGLPTLPPVFKRLIRLTRVGRADPEAAADIERIHYRTLVIGWMASGVSWILMGFSLIAVLRGMDRDSLAWINGLPLATMSVCASVVLGFMSFIPGGLVVRDVVIAELIRPALGAEVAVVSAILLRLVWLTTELAAAGTFYLIHLSRPKPQAESSTAGETHASNSNH